MRQPKRQTQDFPTALLVAEGEPLAGALKRRLELIGLAVEETSDQEAVQAAFVTAPDLMVIAGDAAADGGMELLTRLSEHHATSMTPVVIVGAGATTANAGRTALRHGVVAIVDRNGGVDGMARRINAVARELPSRRGQVSGTLGEAELDQLVGLLTESHRNGMLAVRDLEGDVLMHLVVHGENPVEETIAELAARLRGIGADDRPLRYEFIETSTANLDAVRSRRKDPATARQLMRRRLGLVERDEARARPFREALRATGSQLVVITDGGPELEEARRVQPSVLLVDASTLEDWGADVIREVQNDPILCWASLLVIDYEKVLVGGKLDVPAIASGVLELLQPDLELVTRIRAKPRVDARLEVIGPARTLRAIGSTQNAVRVTVRYPRVKITLSIVDGRVHDAQGMVRGRAVEGTAALANLLHLPTGRLSCERFDPSQTGVGQPLEDALAEASTVRPVFRRSDVPKTMPSAKPFPDIAPPGKGQEPSPSGSQAAKLVDRLERLLGVVGGEMDLDDSTERVESVNVMEDLEPTIEDDEIPTTNYDPALMSNLRRRVLRGHPKVHGAEESKSGREPTIQLGSHPKGASPPWVESGPTDLDQLPDESTSEQIDPTEIEEMLPDEIDIEVATEEPSIEELIPVEEEDEAEPTVYEVVEPWHAKGRAPAPEVGTDADEDTRRDHAAELEAAKQAAMAHAAAEQAEAERRAREMAAREAEAMDRAMESLELPALEPEDDALEALPERGRGVTIGVALVISLVAFGIGGLGAYLYASSQADGMPDPTSAVAPPDDETNASPEEADEAEDEAEESAQTEESEEESDAEAAETEEGEEETAQTEEGEEEAAETEQGEEETAETEEGEEETAETEQGAESVAATGGGAGGSITTDPIEGREEDFDLAALGVELNVNAPRRTVRVRGLNRRGSLSRRRRRWDRAEEAYLEVLSLDPRNGPATIGLIHVYRGQENPERAVLFAQRLARLRPRSALAFVLLSQAFELAEQPDAALAAAERAVEVDPRNRAARRVLRDLRRGR